MAREAAEQDYPSRRLQRQGHDANQNQRVVLNPPKDNLICDPAKVQEILGVRPSA
jgi:hypothetical protein